LIAALTLNCSHVYEGLRMMRNEKLLKFAVLNFTVGRFCSISSFCALRNSVKYDKNYNNMLVIGNKNTVQLCQR